MHSERRRRALLFVFFFVFVFFANDAKGDDDDGDGEKEISPNDDAWKVFLCRLSRRRWSEKATTLTFFHDFLVKPPHRKWLLLLLFDKTTQKRGKERDMKKT